MIIYSVHEGIVVKIEKEQGARLSEKITRLSGMKSTKSSPINIQGYKI